MSSGPLKDDAIEGAQYNQAMQFQGMRAYPSDVMTEPRRRCVRPGPARLILGLLIGACGLLGGCYGPIAGLYPPAADQPTREIYVFNNRWHTGVVLNTSDLSPRARLCLQRFAAYPWVEIGWGDQDFYRAPKGTACLALHAVFLSSGTVVHVVGIQPDPMVFYRAYVVELYRIRLSEEGYRRLEQYVFDSFKTDDQGRPIELQTGLYGFSRFYTGQGHYGLLHTCNNWTAEALRKSGFPITPAWAQTAGNVGQQIRSARRWQADIIARTPDSP